MALELVLELVDSVDFVALLLTDSAADYVSSHSPSTILESLDLQHWPAPAFEGQHQAMIWEA